MTLHEVASELLKHKDRVVIVSDKATLAVSNVIYWLKDEMILIEVGPIEDEGGGE